jgi:phospholipid/cholesterol/gamma-HCH transport system substrate-binding protein
MSKSRLEVKVGLFVFLGLVLLAGLLLQFSKGTAVFRSTYRIQLSADNVGGLQRRASVLLAGVQVGTVSRIHLAPNGKKVFITLKLYREFDVHRDARFVLEQSGFLGDQYVAILPTENLAPRFEDNDQAKAEAPFNLQEAARAAAGFLRRISETANRLNDAIADVRRLVLNEETLTNLSLAVGNFRLVSERALLTVDHANNLLDTNSPAVAEAVSNLVRFSQEINQFAIAFRSALETNVDEITVAVKNVENSTVLLQALLSDVQAGKGVAGNLVKNEELANHVSLIASNLSITTSNLNRLGLWGILWQHKPPRNGSANLIDPR